MRRCWRSPPRSTGRRTSMADRAPLSLLRLATLASLAITPVMIGVLLAVASWREHAVVGAAGSAERHVSVRHVAALKTFEQGVVKQGRAVTAPPDAAALLEALPQCR